MCRQTPTESVFWMEEAILKMAKRRTVLSLVFKRLNNRHGVANILGTGIVRKLVFIPHMVHPCLALYPKPKAEARWWERRKTYWIPNLPIEWKCVLLVHIKTKNSVTRRRTCRKVDLWEENSVFRGSKIPLWPWCSEWQPAFGVFDVENNEKRDHRPSSQFVWESNS